MKNIHPPVNESYAFKFKLGDKIIVFSGDTTYCPALATFASGADYLIHEVMYGPALDEMVERRPKNAARLKASVMAHHAPTKDVGRLPEEANVKNALS